MKLIFIDLGISRNSDGFYLQSQRVKTVKTQVNGRLKHQSKHFSSRKIEERCDHLLNGSVGSNPIAIYFCRSKEPTSRWQVCFLSLKNGIAASCFCTRKLQCTNHTCVSHAVWGPEKERGMGRGISTLTTLVVH